MSLLTKQSAEEILTRLMQSSRVDDIHAILRSSDGTVHRIAGNVPDAPHRTGSSSLQVTVRIGARYASASTNDLSATGLDEVLERAALQAAVMPEAPQALPFPGATEGGSDAEEPGTAAMRVPGSATVARVIETAREADMQLSGSIAATSSTMTVATSRGLFLHSPSDLFHAQFRVFSSDGSSTGFGEHYSSALDEQRILRTVTRAAEKCAAWRNPVEIEPTRITTVFEPRALADLFAPFLQQFSRRAIDEDRSFLRKLDGSTFVGTRMFKESVTLSSDPGAQGLLALPFTVEGLPVRPETWVRDGVIEQVAVDRYSAMQHGGTVVAPPANLMMNGGEQTREELVAGTKRGLLVTGFADLRMIDPKNCLLTGSTRDGVFLIEEGTITGAVKNLLIRETPVFILKELEEFGIPEVTSTTGVYFPMRLPPIRVKDVLYGASSGLI